MAIALPSARGLFSHMQDSLRHVEGERVALTRGVHLALADLHWLMEDLSKYPTRLYELMPIHPMLGGYHDASRYMCGGVVLPGPTAVPMARLFSGVNSNIIKLIGHWCSDKMLGTSMFRQSHS